MSSAEIEELRALLGEVIRLRRHVRHAETSSGGEIDAVRARPRQSAVNLVHCAGPRRQDIRDLQSRLDPADNTAVGAHRIGCTLADVLADNRTGERICSVDGKIARGEPAVEAGYERLTAVLEEILRLCEAAHVPAIRATEVLDTLPRTGRPSRAGVTDAAIEGGTDPSWS